MMYFYFGLPSGTRVLARTPVTARVAFLASLSVSKTLQLVRIRVKVAVRLLPRQ